MVYGLGPSKPPLAFGVLLVRMMLLNSYRSVWQSFARNSMKKLGYVILDGLTKRR